MIARHDQQALCSPGRLPGNKAVYPLLVFRPDEGPCSSLTQINVVVVVSSATCCGGRYELVTAI
jgi:hypothetical protein